MLEKAQKSRPVARRKAAAAALHAAPPQAHSPWAAPQHRAARRQVKREAVILTAARAFQQRGYHNTSLDDLAAILQVTKPTLYHYVANKEEILFECFRTGLDQIRAGFASAEAGDGPARERLRVVVQRYAEAIASDFGWCMVRAEDQDLSPAMGRRIKALKSEIDQGLRRLIRLGIDDGSIRACDPKMMAFAIAGALNWIGHWYRPNETLAPREVADRFIEVFDLGPRAQPQARGYNTRPARAAR
jgi:AcrR family transcriptional regulator